jgi:hypothetical protein
MCDAGCVVARRLVLVGLLATVAAVGAAGCGDGDGDEPRQATGPEERADPRGPLPKGWKRVVNRRAGFSVGIPPGWKARRVRGSTLVRSGDRLLAVSIAADRSPEGKTLPPKAYARRTARSLAGYRDLRVGVAARVRGARYPTGTVTAQGRYIRTRVRQAIRVVALQRRGQVTFALVFFRTARSPGALYRPAIEGMVRTFRAQPPVVVRDSDK